MNQLAIQGVSVVDVDIDPFDTAKRLAAISSELDDTKHNFNAEIRSAAMSCIWSMQEMVELLAGARVGEIYDLTE